MHEVLAGFPEEEVRTRLDTDSIWARLAVRTV